ncbi:MAG: ABC transporter ATP-binding protein [Acidobacteriota bacterium]|jgi:fluoroquinolone transport system ATP-binding protein|nr:ABC transporter ATP-binding protein [Acidobacteriota bacterium]
MIKVTNLSYTYPKSSDITLKNLNFEIDRGEIFGFLGPSGAGKSTTQKVLYKILNNFEGEISVNDKSLKNWGKEYFERIGVGFELPNHYLKLTAKENLELFASFYKQENLQGFDQLFAIVGLEDSINKRVEEYSKGMKMRLNFIRSIMHDPDILFFDEPTAGLDPINAQKIKRHIQKLKDQGKTIFVTTHDMATADELCDRVSFIVDGEIRLTEKPVILKNKYGKHTVKVDLQNQRSAEFPVENLGNNPKFLEFIKQDEILKINSQEATLEEVFIKITGTKL